MGIASSNTSGVAGEGDHFVQIVNPQRIRPLSGNATTSSVNDQNSKDKKLGIEPRARILRRLCYEDVWESFLEQGYPSFALTHAETQVVLEAAANHTMENPHVHTNSAVAATKSKAKSEKAVIDQEIKDFLALWLELNPSKVIDIMSICSACLLLSPDIRLEDKVDQLFEWIVIDPAEIAAGFTFDDFIVALSSFERGLSNAMGRTNCSEGFIKGTAHSWCTLAAPQSKGINSRFSDKQFFEFCTNRQHVVRRLLEGLVTLDILENKNMELQEVQNEDIESLISPPAGDEWMANPAWKKTAEKMIPPLAKQIYRNSKPQSNLELEWVHGYRGYDCRNNISFLNSHQIVFTAAALCIVQDNRLKKSQYYFSEHGDDILSLASVSLDENTTLIATGEIGKTPAIYVYTWVCKREGNGGSFLPLACLRGCHTKGVSQLCFSKDGKYLFSISVEYAVAIYCTDKNNSKLCGKMISSSQGPKDRLMHCAYIISSGGKDKYSFVTCGEKHAILWKFDSTVGLLSQEVVRLGPHKNKVLLCAASFPGGALFATAEGELLYATESSPNATAITLDKSSLGCHEKTAINALWQTNDGSIFVSGDKDGKIVGWQFQATGPCLKALWEFTLVGFIRSVELEGLSGSLNGRAGESIKPPSVRAIAIDNTFRHLLVGTHHCELIEYEFTDCLNISFPRGSFGGNLRRSEVLVSGHFQDEVWGLAVRPITELNVAEGVQYATVGDDGYLRLWDLKKHSLIKCLNLQGVARCCAYSPDGLYIAIGFGSGKTQPQKSGKAVKGKEDGMVKVIRFDYNKDSTDFKLTQVAEIREAKQWISVVKFSPDGTILAVGARDNSLYLYGVPMQFKRKVKFSKHNAGIAQFDFSACGKYIQSCCSAYEILFSEVQTGGQVTDGASKLKDVEWDTWNCTLGWPVIGIWSGSMDGSDINNVDRSPSGKYIATCDDFGKVNIFNYPALQEKGALCNSYSGHSSHVTCCRWASLPPRHKKRALKTKSDDFLISIGGEDKCVFQWRHTDSSSKREDLGEDDDSNSASAGVEDVAVEFDAPEGGDEFMAVKPWLGAIVAPTAWSNADPGKLPALHASLSEYASTLNEISQLDDVPSSDAYEGLIVATDTVLRRMYDSGFVDHSAPSNDELELDWVHGYRGFDCRNNVFYIQIKGGKRYVLYYAAALGILFDPKVKHQRYFKGHSDDIVSMAIYEQGNNNSSEQVIVASGQQGISSVYVWEVPSMQTLAVVETKQKNLYLLSFSSDGRLIVSIGQDLSITISDWKSSTLLATAKMENSTVFDMSIISSPLVQSGKNGGAAAASVQFLTSGDKALRMWSVNGRNITSKKITTTGTKNVNAKVQQFLCTVEIRGSFYVGCEDGNIYVIHGDGTSVKGVLEAPKSEEGTGKSKKSGNNSITAMSRYVTDDIAWILCGTKEGTVLIWNVGTNSPTIIFSFALHAVPGLNDILAKQIQSVSMIALPSKDPRKEFNDVLLFALGTRGCDLVEVEVRWDAEKRLFNGGDPNPAKLHIDDSKCKGVITRGHCNEELWGIATHPKLPQYCSVGDDKTLRFYDIHSKTMLMVVALGHISRTVTYNHDGTLLALGFGGRVGKGKETGGGIVRVYNLKQEGGRIVEVTKAAERQDAKQWISDIKFSSDSRILVAGAHDCKIYIYNVLQQGSTVVLQLRSTFGKHNSVINHLDLSNDGRYMQSNCSAYELLFCETSTGRQITAASELKDVKWQTWTCTLGWPVQGIWKGSMDGSDINAVCRSNSGHLLVTTDDFGKVNLYRYPVLDPANSKALSYGGHSSHVMNARWTCGDECLISAGGNDKCLLQWRHRITDASYISSGPGGKGDKKVRIEEASDDVGLDGEDLNAEFSDDLLDGPAGGDESGAVKPWVGAVRPPKNPPPVSAQAPAVDMNLVWAHGYSCSAPSQRNNLFYNLGQKLIYPVASMAVLLERSPEQTMAEWKQHYFKGHDDDVLCITMSRDRRYIATGQIASKSLKGKASVIVWDAVQCRLLSRMEGCHQRGVLSLSFNDAGNQLISIGMDDSFTHILWSDLGGSWSRVQQLSNAKGDKQPTLFADWVTNENTSLWADCQFISGGVRSMSMWKIEGASLTKKQARLGKKVQASTYLCMVNMNAKDGWTVFFGTSNGDILTLENRELQLCVEKAHDQAIQALVASSDGSFMLSGGKDGCIKIWNQSMQMTSYFELQTAASALQLPLFDTAVVAVDICPNHLLVNNTMILAVGTAGGDIVEIAVPPLLTKSIKAPALSDSQSDQSSLTFDFSKAQVSHLLSSHTKGELWGLAVNPSNPDIFATVGDDKVLRLWSIKYNRCIHAKILPRASRCLAWHPQTSILAVGLEELKKSGGKGKGKSTKGAAANKKGKPSKGPEDDEEVENKGEGAEDYSGMSVLMFAANIPNLSSTSARGDDTETMMGEVCLELRASGCSTYKADKATAFPSVADIKFSLDGKLLCIAPKDCKMYGYELPIVTHDPNAPSFPWDDFNAKLQVKNPSFVFNKHSSMITHFDFSVDGKYIQSNDLGNELLFYDIENKRQEPSATKVADYNGVLDDDEGEGRLWLSQTCIFGWPVQGIWPPNAYDSSDINAVDRHNATKKYLATGEDSGNIRVLRFPSVIPNSSSVVLTGHSSHVTNVRWSAQHLISTGGNDKSVFVWEMIEK